MKRPCLFLCWIHSVICLCIKEVINLLITTMTDLWVRLLGGCVCMTMSMRKSLLCLWRDFVCLLALWIFSMWLLQVHSILTGIVFIFVWTPYVHFLVTFCWVFATVLMKGYFVSIWVGMRVNWDGCFCIKKKSSLISVFMCVCLFVERKAENFFFLNVN